MKKNQVISKKDIAKAVARSSRLEGLSYRKAMNDTAAIKFLKKHGHAFSL